MSTGRNVVIDRGIGGRDPFSKVLAQLVPYKKGQAFVIDGDDVRSLRTVLVSGLIEYLSNRHSVLHYT